MIDEIRATLRENLSRVEHLIYTYESHPDTRGQGRKAAEQLDTLRAAVVFLHAALEDVLRSIAQWKLPGASRAELDKVPLSGMGPSPKKFLLGELVPHRGKSVDQLLAESVREHLEQSNYNNTDDIARLLEAIPVQITKVNARFGDLDIVMKRRHQIVHRADRKKEVSGSGDHQIRAINKDIVRGWAAAVGDFCDTLLDEVPP